LFGIDLLKMLIFFTRVFLAKGCSRSMLSLCAQNDACWQCGLFQW